MNREGYQAIAMENIDEVLNFIQNEIPKDETVIQFGSLYLVGEMKQILKKRENN